RALDLGAKAHATLDITQEYYEKSIKYMIFGNVLRNGTYPISVSSERTFQAIAIIEYAKKIGADCVAHGSTSAGNDQVRFDLTFQIIAPEIEIITPTRDMNLTREYEINYLKEHGYVADFKKMEYSINKGLWGTSVGGKETLHSDQTLPEEAYPTHVTATADSQLTIDFTDGEISAVNGEEYSDKVKAIQKIEELVAPYALGRDMHVGDTIIGIKGRVGFEAGAPMVILAAHKMLEKHTLTKWQQYWKDQMGTWYGLFLHEAQYLDPVMRDIEAFLESSQRNVTGRVIIDLKPYRFITVGVQSPYDLMKSVFGEYGEVSKGWTADDIKGFTRILGNQMKIYYAVQERNGKTREA
ncbi:MAG: argininosuccinate synthase, partial [Muribaculum sp.]|nr:argininosuccinate synthase [Muribaculum sp.]